MLSLNNQPHVKLLSFGINIGIFIESIYKWINKGFSVLEFIEFIKVIENLRIS